MAEAVEKETERVQKIDYRCVIASSSEQPEDDYYALTEKLKSENGWMSEGNCDYPQELVLALGTVANVWKVQLTPQRTAIRK